MPAEGRQEPANAHVGKRRNDAATFTMEKKKDAAAPHAPRMADMVRHCHRMAAVRGGGHMRRYVTTGRHGPGCQRQPLFLESTVLQSARLFPTGGSCLLPILISTSTAAAAVMVAGLGLLS
eukprot:COSAG01_NODE_11387_length_1946_cov_49.485652_2_plen_121_part_00